MSAMPAEAEPVPGSSARPSPARPVTVRPPSQPGSFAPAPAAADIADIAATDPDPAVPGPARPASGRARQAGVRPRKAGVRQHPFGVRACSSVSSIGRAEPAAEITTTVRDARVLATVVPLRPAARDSRLAPPIEPGGQRAQAEHPAGSPHLRLTRRGRSVLATVGVLIASLIWFAAATAAQASDHSAPPHPAGHAMSQIVVQPGQTLWSIAAQADPAADTRLVIQRIVTANSLTSENIAAGQRLWIPGN